jgi:hypothetical protein
MSLLVFICHFFNAWTKHLDVDDARCLRSAFGAFSESEFKEAMTNVRILESQVVCCIETDFRRILLQFAYDEWVRRRPQDAASSLWPRRD